MGNTAGHFCNGCGLCCMHMRTPPFLPRNSDPRWRDLPRELKNEIEKSWMFSPRMALADKLYGDDLPCIWLNVATGECRHYEYRPDICREYEPGNTSCRSLRQQVGLTVKGMPVVSDDNC